MEYTEFKSVCELGNLVHGYKSLDRLNVNSLMGSALVIKVCTSSTEVANVALYINSKEDVNRIENLISDLKDSLEVTLEDKKAFLEAQLRDLNRILIGEEEENEDQYRAEKGMNQ